MRCAPWARGWHGPGTLTIDNYTADDGLPQTADPAHLKFSLDGIQLKFSMLRQGERYTLNTGGRLGNGDAHIEN